VDIFTSRRLRDWRTIGAAALALGGVAAAVIATTPGAPSGRAAAGAAGFTAQGGCDPYQVAGFDISVCISDNGTGTTAYPSITVNQVGPYVGSCSIGIELWDDDGHTYSDTGPGDCTPGQHPGKAFGPVTAPLTLHAFAYLQTDLNSFHLGNRQGDSPRIELEPTATVVVSPTVAPSTSTSAAPRPFPPIPRLATRNKTNANCLDPANRPGAAAANGAGGGWILNTTSDIPHRNITTTPNDPTFRAEQATACLAKPLGPGQEAQQLDIAGWQDAQIVANKWGMTLPGQSLARCHLVANVLGGQGFAQNLVPCWQIGVNIAGEQSMRAQESIAADTVNGRLAPGQAVFYEVTPNYQRPDSTIPESIHMAAQVEDTDGTILQNLFDVDIPNQAYVDGAVVPLGN
jgi:hypothetical protein